jgi:hypothetical protein
MRANVLSHTVTFLATNHFVAARRFVRSFSSGSEQKTTELLPHPDEVSARIESSLAADHPRRDRPALCECYEWPR